ncbi:molybdopterin-dependent oxidoreductase [Campylobacter sputorum]|uniref:molybdopterin-dependent oxidoreductase n=1 Tax=Campylobacter sputorum TaxID=206 RepID=UPI001E40BCB7|nr:molybdopterin-dependent oxidoreductase [Campylobacter sputorum]
MKRRDFLLGTAAATGALSVEGYNEALSSLVTLSSKGQNADDAIYGDAPKTEISFKDGKMTINEDFKVFPSVCNGCTTHCSVRVKIDKNGKIKRIFGNPYSLLSSDPWLDYKTSLQDSFKFTSDTKNVNRSTVCARGNIVFDKIDDKFRVTTPLKRAGKRGENKWVKISPEELIKEIVNGGDLFGEGHVKGLKEIRNLEQNIDDENPEFGKMVNKLAIFGTGDEGRQKFIQQRFMQSFGTINFAGHTGTCGLSMRAGEAAYLNNFKNYPHVKPDFENCKFILNIATAPSQAGNPFKRQAHLLAKSRTNGDLKYVTITPTLTNSDNIAVSSSSKWVPILPGSDLAFVMAMIRYIIENNRYNIDYLEIPSKERMNELNEHSFTNASHLIDKKTGKFLRDDGNFMVFDKESKSIISANLSKAGELLYEDENLKTSFVELKNNANEKSLDEYSKICGVSVEDIISLSIEFTSHGRAVATDCHGGTMHTTGFYTTYAIMMLGALVGNLNYKGGVSMGGGGFKDINGAKYNFTAYEGKVKPSGVRIDKSKFSYEKTSEYKRKIEAKQNPYPAKGMWYPLTNANQQDFVANSANSYPYSLDCLISWNTNFIYAQSGSESVKEALKDPKKGIPLFIAIDPFINESSIFADYIVPDSVMYETWGVVSPWGASQTKASNFRYPIIESKNDKFANGEPITMDSFVIELGKALNLPGFGKDAIYGNDGSKFSLDRPQDYYLRVFENVFLDGKNPAPQISDEELKLSGLETMYKDKLEEVCGENWRKVAYAMARGGRFEDKSKSYEGEYINKIYDIPIAIYNEDVANFTNSLTGEKFSGSPKFYAPRYTDGKEFNLNNSLLAFSYKSAVFSSPTTASSNLKRIFYTNFIEINTKTAKNLGIKDGDIVEISSSSNTLAYIAKVKQGIHPKAIAISHGVGRDGEGANDIYIDGKLIKGFAFRKTGININKLGLRDLSKGKYHTLCDFMIGSNARQAIPVTIKKV